MTREPALTVEQVHAALAQAIANGRGQWPVVLFEVHGGIPSTSNVWRADEAPPYDGEIFRIFVEEQRDPPEWLGAAHAAIGA